MKLPAWSIVQYATSTGQTMVGLQSDQQIFAAPASWPTSLIDMLSNWSRWKHELRSLDLETLTEVADADLLAPITYPNKVICAGANYYDHAKEMGTEVPNPDAEPFFFLKTPSTTIIGDGGDIPYPGHPDPRLDWEAELAIVIGNRCHNVSPAEARSHVAGYLASNDISARGLLPRHDAVFPAFGWDWVSHKSLDGFCPIGPGFVPEFMIDDPQNLSIELSVNGVLKQNSSTSNMVVDVDRLVSAASRLMTLEPGDLILTGTPAGVGMPRSEFLAVGDVVVVQIEGIGRLTNTVVAA